MGSGLDEMVKNSGFLMVLTAGKMMPSLDDPLDIFDRRGLNGAEGVCSRFESTLKKVEKIKLNAVDFLSWRT